MSDLTSPQSVAFSRFSPGRFGRSTLDSTPRLLQNVDVLSDFLGMDLLLEVAEHPLSNSSLDLLGHDANTARWSSWGTSSSIPTTRISD